MYLQSVLSTGFAFCIMWDVMQNAYMEPHAATRIDFHKERGKVSCELRKQDWTVVVNVALFMTSR